jgi:hypothetical protein
MSNKSKQLYTLMKYFDLGKNSKVPLTGVTWRDPKNHKCGKKPLGNFGIPTGKVNNIFVLDLDTSKWNNRSCKSLLPSGNHPFVEKFGSLKTFIKQTDTYTVQTQSGGYHLYFNLPNNQCSYQNSCKHHQIDLRGNGGYVVGPGSKIGKNKYRHVHGQPNAIKDCPPELHSWVIDQIVCKNFQNKGPKKFTKSMFSCHKNISQSLAGSTNNDMWAYNISDKVILQIVDDLPSSYLNDRSDWLKLTTFFKILDKKDLWDQVSRQGDGYNQQKNNKTWRSINPNGLEMVVHILKTAKWYWYLPYIKFKPILKNKVKPHVVFNRPKLGLDFFDVYASRKHVVVKSDTGTGKTTSTKNYFKKHQHNFISIVSRRSLGMEQHKTFNMAGLDCNYYERHDFEQGCSYITTIDSFHKKCCDANLEDYVLFFDEWSSIVEYMLDSNTLSTNRIVTFKFLINAIKNANQCIYVDADINDNCFEILNHLKQGFTFVQNEFIHNSGVKSKEYFQESKMIGRLKKLNKYIVCCDSKTIAVNLHTELNDKSIKLYTSDNDEYLDMDTHDKIIYSPKIIYGLDSSIDREVFCFYKEHTITPKAMLQQIARCRNIKRLNYLFTKKKIAEPRYKTISECVKYVMKANKKSIDEFGLLCDESVNELYIKMLSVVAYNKDAYNTNKFGHFKLYRQQKAPEDDRRKEARGK